MVVLAGSSAIVAPLLLQLLLPLLGGDSTLQIDAIQIARALLITQLLPLCAGLAVRHWRPATADRLQQPANLLSAGLSLLTIGVILFVHFHLLLEITFRAYLGMTALLVASWLTGWLLGGTGHDNRRAMAITTALRNVGVALMIATDRFAGTAAVTATVAYGLFEIFGTLLLAFWWARAAPSPQGGDVR
jgi:BASS family bile acid:Na+ symporter